MVVVAALGVAALAVDVCRADAQWLPSQPIVALDGRLTISGDAAVSMSTSDHDSYYNYGDYAHDMMRLIRLGLAANLRLNSRVSAVADIRGEGETLESSWTAYPVALYLKVKPLRGSQISVMAGIVQPVFGAFTQRRYGGDNLLIGYPLTYQYTTAVRADALPTTPDEIIKNRAKGWAPRYSVGAGSGVSGLPIVSATGWSPGIAVSGGTRLFSATVAVTRGGMAAAGSSEWRGRWEVTARATLQPTPGLVLGVSGAHGAFVATSLDSVVATAETGRAPRETGAGVDAEYSRGYWLFRAEAVYSRRTYPTFVSAQPIDPLTSVAIDSEVRYKILPGLYAAARFDRIFFGSISSSSGVSGWDADVSRLETGFGYTVIRNLLVKTVYQYNRRDSVKHPSLHLGAVQLAFRF